MTSAVDAFGERSHWSDEEKRKGKRGPNISETILSKPKIQTPLFINASVPLIVKFSLFFRVNIIIMTDHPDPASSNRFLSRFTPIVEEVMYKYDY
jgi:hypothetical protein